MANAQRYRFASDDDGHNYLILESEVDTFEYWLSHEADDDYEGKDFNEDRIDSEHNYSFTDPQED